MQPVSLSMSTPFSTRKVQCMKTSDVFIMLTHTLMHLQHVDGYGDLLRHMHVYNMIQIKLLLQHVQNGTTLYLGQLCQPFLHRTQINCF